jgi:hypothetical protein
MNSLDTIMFVIDANLHNINRNITNNTSDNDNNNTNTTNTNGSTIKNIFVNVLLNQLIISTSICNYSSEMLILHRDNNKSQKYCRSIDQTLNRITNHSYDHVKVGTNLTNEGEIEKVDSLSNITNKGEIVLGRVSHVDIENENYRDLSTVSMFSTRIESVRLIENIDGLLLGIYLSMYLSLYVSISLCIYLSMYLYLYVYVSIYVCISYVSNCLSV